MVLVANNQFNQFTYNSINKSSQYNTYHTLRLFLWTCLFTNVSVDVLVLLLYTFFLSFFVSSFFSNILFLRILFPNYFFCIYIFFPDIWGNNICFQCSDWNCDRPMFHTDSDMFIVCCLSITAWFKAWR